METPNKQFHQFGIGDYLIYEDRVWRKGYHGMIISCQGQREIVIVNDGRRFFVVATPDALRQMNIAFTPTLFD